MLLTVHSVMHHWLIQWKKGEFSEVKSGLQQNALGVLLLQNDEAKKSHVSYDSRKLKTSEKAYAVIEKECFALVWGIQKFHRYIYGAAFLVTTVHQPLSYLNKAKLSNPRLMRWALTLQPYPFHIVMIRGSDNVEADCLRRTGELVQL